MKFALPLLAFAAAAMVFMGIRSSQRSDYIQTRRFEISEVMRVGGENERQRKLYDFYRAALESGRDNLFRRTFEKAGIGFPEGTGVFLNPTDTQLYITHRVSVLDTIQRDFSIYGFPYQPPSRVRLFMEDMLERIGIGSRDAFE